MHSKQEDGGYWKMHVPVSNRKVRFHRQLLQDFLGDALEGKDAHHGRRGLDYNCTWDLEPKPLALHRAEHGSEGGRGSNGRGRGPGGTKRKRTW